jgi:hypothetical protein
MEGCPFLSACGGREILPFRDHFQTHTASAMSSSPIKRKRNVIFISHCWLNINTRFPEGCAFEGANVPLMQTLLNSGLGIIQMPCPEYECLGLEKWRYGELSGEDLRGGFSKSSRYSRQTNYRLSWLSGLILLAFSGWIQAHPVA